MRKFTQIEELVAELESKYQQLTFSKLQELLDDRSSWPELLRRWDDEVCNSKDTEISFQSGYEAQELEEIDSNLKKDDLFNPNYACLETPVGRALVATDGESIYACRFIGKSEVSEIINEIEKEFSFSQLNENCENLRISTPEHEIENDKLFPNSRLKLQGTRFQARVWEELRNIPAGEVCSYQEVAEQIGNPKAVRAVASAVANNPIACFIPCHRVIRKTGVINNYRWTRGRKVLLLILEHLQSKK
jgi:O-6-methylguanine DNA methyltransferase